MITLYQPPAVWGVPSMSPFGVKLETWLRWSGIEFQVRPGSPQKAPRGKLPYIRDEDGAILGDTHLIIQHLSARTGGLDGWLTPTQHAQAHALRRMAEEATYWGIVHLRWARDSGFVHVREALGTILPLPRWVQPMAMPLIRKTALDQLQRQGTGRHTDEVIDAMIQADLDAIATALGAGPYLFGERPCTADAAVFAMVNGVLGFPADSAPRRFAAAQPALAGYHDRIVTALWPAGTAPVRAAESTG